MARPFSKILVANRAEIACRVMRSARRLGFRTVAVYSDADADALHVSESDEAVRVGEGPAADSYLNIERLLDAARRSAADAVHPGYGFLSERAEFAEACLAAGLVFIGPAPDAIRTMGDKALAKRRMLQAGVPCVPGYLGESQADADLGEAALRLGLPLLIKAVAGGGGRGMRQVQSPDEWPAALAAARREALGAFGDARVMLERVIERARHVEVQVLADAQGHVIHLGERDCTAQRRRQKVLEEAPAPGIDPEIRRAMGDAATAAARAVGYQGAGTVEFLVDAQGDFYFLEMNTRLQVEHPVTECITGIDLVEWQLRVAAGETLPWQQEEVHFDGHAVQARLVAEDPYDGWRPHAGTVLSWRPQDAGIRVDHGLAQGQSIPPHYDAMVAKFIAHGRNREDALRRLGRALEDAPLFGPLTNARFLRDLIRHPDFIASRLTTTDLDGWAANAEPLLRRPLPPDALWPIAAALWAGSAGQRPRSVAAYDLTLQCGDLRRTLRMPQTDITVLDLSLGWARVDMRGHQRRMACLRTAHELWLSQDAATFRFTEASPYPASEADTDRRTLHSPVAGTVAQVLVAAGDAVLAGQPLVSVEAMKMEMWVRSAADARVKRVAVQSGVPVAAGSVLVELEADDV